MPASVLTSKGQTTIPKKIREHLKLQPGDSIDFVVKEDGKVELEPATIDVRELQGMLYRPGMKALSEKEIREALRNRFKRS